jgi:hypothetical protein|tara:strand:- start:340 stop:501 length:162 start_codon:yes stop_codon:yes gene_type:complete
MADLIGKLLIIVIGFAVCIMAFAMSLRGGFGVLPVLIFFGGFMSIYLSLPSYD